MAEPRLPSRDTQVSHRDVLRLALPMTLAYLSTPLVGFVDTAIIGRLGNPSLLGGIAVGAIIFDFIFVAFNFLRMGTTALTAQAAGKDDSIEVRAIFFRTLIIAAISGLALALIHKPGLAIGLGFMAASDEVNRAASTYFTIRIFGSFFELANYAILGWLLGQGRAGLGLMLQTILNGGNVACSVWLVTVLGWEVEGVAWGTFIAQAVAMIIGFGVVFSLTGRALFVPMEKILSAVGFRRLLVVNRDLVLRSLILVFAFSFFTAQSARQGEIILAANAILMNFFAIAGYFLDGFAASAETLVGTAIGRRSRAMVQRSVKLTVTWGVGLGVITSGFFLLLGPHLIDFVTTSPEVRQTARDYLLWAALTPLVGVLAFEFDGVYIGATWGRDMRNMMLTSLAIGGIIWGVAMPLLANDGLWLALHGFLIARGLTLLARYPRCLAREFA